MSSDDHDETVDESKDIGVIEMMPGMDTDIALSEVRIQTSLRSGLDMGHQMGMNAANSTVFDAKNQTRTSGL